MNKICSFDVSVYSTFLKNVNNGVTLTLTLQCYADVRSSCNIVNCALVSLSRQWGSSKSFQMKLWNDLLHSTVIIVTQFFISVLKSSSRPQQCTNVTLIAGETSLFRTERIYISQPSLTLIISLYTTTGKLSNSAIHKTFNIYYFLMKESTTAIHKLITGTFHAEMGQKDL